MIRLALLVATLANAQIKTIIHWSRRVDTCDPEDRAVLNTTTKVVWSYNSQDPISETEIPYHESRGISSVRFFNQELPYTPPSTQYYVDVIQSNVTVPFNVDRNAPSTNFFCTAHKVDLNKKYHIFRVEFLLDPRTRENVRRVMIYKCNNKLTDQDLQYRGSCSSSNVSKDIQMCYGKDLLHVWSAGGVAFNYPDTTAMPIGPDSTYLLMEVLYENPQQNTIVDNSGLRFWYTDQYREHEVGVLLVSHVIQSSFTIPARSLSYGYDAWCPSQCTSNLFPDTGVNIIAGTLHTHAAGVQTRLSHIRNGQELPPLIAEPYYDFNVQDFTTLQPARGVLPGDTFHLSCQYDTSDRDYDTTFGFETHNEICNGYLFYYPRLSSDNLECTYADYTGMDMSPALNKTILCGNTVSNWEPQSYIPYQPPACTYNPPLADNVSILSLQLEQYEHSIFLDSEEKYQLHWTLNKQTQELHAAVEVETAGWVGFGFSPSGMTGSDVSIGWVKDGELYFRDRIAKSQSLPDIDKLQDYHNLKGLEVKIPSANSPSSGEEEEVMTPMEIAAVIVGAFALIALIGYVIVNRKKPGQEAYQGFTDERSLEMIEKRVNENSKAPLNTNTSSRDHNHNHNHSHEQKNRSSSKENSVVVSSEV